MSVLMVVWRYPVQKVFPAFLLVVTELLHMASQSQDIYVMLHICPNRAKPDLEWFPLLPEEHSPRCPCPLLAITANKDIACLLAKVEYVPVGASERFDNE
jgi:hypothetical protein